MKLRDGLFDANDYRPRARDLGLMLGKLKPGMYNGITDVAGVLVGHCTVSVGDGKLVPGEGPVRTGVTAIIPHSEGVFANKVPAAVHVINGFGKAVGFVQVEECGVLETPILLTNTLNVGLVADAVVDYMLQNEETIGVTTGTVNPVVTECNDGYLNDIRGRHVGSDHVITALNNARSGIVTEGAVGAGTGMSAFGWKGGIGTSSRVIHADESTDYVLGALVLSNYGSAHDLTMGGWPVGRYLPDPNLYRSAEFGTSLESNQTRRPDTVRSDEGDGSVVIVIATDAPVDARQLRRIAARAVVGIVRCGSRLSHGSGDYVIAFSTSRHIRHTFDQTHSGLRTGSCSSLRKSETNWPDDGQVMADLLRAAGEATEESVLNSMLQARTVVGRDGNVRHALPVDQLREMINHFESSIGNKR